MSRQGATATVGMGDGHLIRRMSANPVVGIPVSTPSGEFTVEFCF